MPRRQVPTGRILPAPDAPGAYEIRYVAGESGRVLARIGLQVVPVQASLNAPETVMAGRPAQIHWQGPGRENDYITVVSPNTPDRGQGARAYTRDGNPATLTMPDKPGAYEIRYITAYSNTVAARRALQVERSTTRPR